MATAEETAAANHVLVSESIMTQTEIRRKLQVNTVLHLVFMHSILHHIFFFRYFRLVMR